MNYRSDLPNHNLQLISPGGIQTHSEVRRALFSLYAKILRSTGMSFYLSITALSLNGSPQVLGNKNYFIFVIFR
jgi:hypothetical protein